MAVLLLPLAAGAAIHAAGITTSTLAMAAITTAAAGVGSFIDSALFGGGSVSQASQGPRLDNARIQTSIEGSPIPRCFGRNRVPGEIIWASRYKETAVTTTTTSSSGGGKGGGGGGGAQTTTTTQYKYSGSFAIGLCEGPIIKVNRIWADGKLMNLEGVTYRIYLGTQTQSPDSKIVAVEGADVTPAYRGLAYIVFEDLPLEPYGNRIPQLNVEVYSFARTDQGELEYRLPGFNIIPAAGEYAYDPEIVVTTQITGGTGGLGWAVAHLAAPTRVENAHTGRDQSNWELAMDDVKALAPNATLMQIVSTWYGSDLRAANCAIKPKVETHARVAKDATNEWWVGGINRASADLVPSDSLGPLLGGTPSDLSIFKAIQDLKARGYKVSFYPFLYMDIVSGNTLPNPYSDNASGVGQAVLPWRGRITISPAAGYSGTVDKTAAAATQINTFFGACSVGHFGAWNGFTIPYSGPAEWSYRRLILHYAKLCAAAGGVDLFFIGTEMVNIMNARSATSTYPGVSKMITLAADVTAILPNAKLSYAADWSEWNGHHPTDGSNDVHFHLDPLWADSNIDYVGIDNYMPLSDWRDEPAHLDAVLYDSIYTQEYLQGNIEAGELYDWYYASTSDRNNQVRTDITDGSYNKPWVFRRKDIKNWWLNQHYNRPGGIQSGAPTAWVPQSKPIIFSELGCPAIDKGTNQPNVFYDPKSSESFYPYFSSGARDDFIQRMFIQAWLDYYNLTANNPTSVVYSDKMIKMDYIALWTWDARPYPYYPNRSDIWRDSNNWRLGHWLNGRLGQITLPDLVSRLVADLNISLDVSKLFGLVMGYQLERVISAREALEPLALAYLFDAFESQGQIRFRHRGGRHDWTLSASDLIPIDAEGTTYSVQRMQDTDLPAQSLIKFVDEAADYNQGVVQAKRLIGKSDRVAESTIALVSSHDKLGPINDIVLMDAWLKRERVTCKLPPSLLAADPTDIIKLTLEGVENEYRIEEINFAYERAAELVRTDRGLYFKANVPETVKQVANPDPVVAAYIDFVECPLFTDTDNPGAPLLAVFSDPWKPIVTYRSPTTSNYLFDTRVEIPAYVGTLELALAAGPEDVWDWGNKIRVIMLNPNTTLSSVDELQVLSGPTNTAAIKCTNGEWEIIQWVTATLVDTSTYELTQLLRARLGTEDAMNSGAVVGAQFVLLDGVPMSTVGVSLRNTLLNWKYGPVTRDFSDASYLTVQYAPKATGLRPYSPVHLTATSAGGNITLTWIRRTRLPESGDTWEGLDPPLGEESELYEVDIYNALGTTVLRTLRVTSSTVTYTAAMQIVDFGSSQTFVDFKVYQISTLYGRGTGRRLKVTGL